MSAHSVLHGYAVLTGMRKNMAVSFLPQKPHVPVQAAHGSQGLVEGPTAWGKLKRESWKGLQENSGEPPRTLLNEPEFESQEDLGLMQ